MRAVRSALAQTVRELEVVVVVDGEDPETTSALSEVDDSRLRLVHLPDSRGGSAARNAGVAASATEWVAFLDDDDEWHPAKLEKQLALAETLTAAEPIVACRMTAETPRARFVVPRRLPRPGEHVSDYLFRRRSLFQGEGTFFTSMLLVRREVMARVPFDEALSACQDLDWLLRATRSGAQLHFVPDDLGVWHLDEDRPRIVTSARWPPLLQWMEGCRERGLVTSEAYAAFLMTQVNSLVSKDGDRRAFWRLWRLSVRHGKPGVQEYLLLFAIWLIPQRPRRFVRDLVLRHLPGRGR